MSATRAFACLWAVAAAGTLTLAQGPQQPTFRTGVQLVRIDVSVLDGRRKPVRDLQASDFTVLEDGQPRPIRSFEFVENTATRSQSAAMAPLPAANVASNQIGSETSRLIFILMDRSIPAERPMLIARQVADAAIDAMAPGDLAAIVTTSGGVPQNLTSDRARLHKTIAATNWSETISQTEKDDPNLWLIRAFGLLESKTDGACLCGVCGMNTITQVANQVRGLPRRKVLLYVGSDLIVQVGMNVGETRGMSCEKVARDSREKLFDALQTSGLTVHAIDPQGLASVGPATRVTVPNGVPGRDGAVLNGQLTQERADFMKAQGNLDVLPALTGGRTILNSNEPFRVVPDVLRESESYYLLAFEPLESRGEVRHEIEVKVARKGLAVHTARYIAPAGAATTAAPAPAEPSISEATLERALTGVLPDASLPLDMSVATFAGPDRAHAYVSVTLNASSFATTPGTIPLEIAVLASDERGRRVGGARQNGAVQIPPSTASSGTAPFVELQTSLTLPPGDYELRSVVLRPEIRSASSVFTHITVPAFDDVPLALSDLVLGTREAESARDNAAIPAITPTTRRSFRTGDAAWAFARVYRRPTVSTANVRVSLELSVLDAAGKRVVRQSLPDATFSGRAADVRVGLPLKGLAAGPYTLRIDAKQGPLEASRAITFSVAPSPVVLTQEHSPELDAALAAVAAYLDQYERLITGIGAEELYEQAVQRPNTVPATGNIGNRRAPMGNAPMAAATRKTQAHVMTIGLGGQGWVSFRDVFEVDGRVVRDGPDRLRRILQNVTADSLDQARRIADESARYNLDLDGARIDRTINVPMTALHFLRAINQPRSVFRLGRRERVGGVDCVTLEFTEQSRPRLIRTRDDAAAQGTFWIDIVNGGRVVRSALRMESVGNGGELLRSATTVSYALNTKLDMWVPAVMDDTYELVTSRQMLTGHATYGDYRQFTVTTSEGIR